MEPIFLVASCDSAGFSPPWMMIPHWLKSWGRKHREKSHSDNQTWQWAITISHPFIEVFYGFLQLHVSSVYRGFLWFSCTKTSIIKDFQVMSWGYAQPGPAHSFTLCTSQGARTGQLLSHGSASSRRCSPAIWRQGATATDVHSVVSKGTSEIAINCPY